MDEMKIVDMIEAMPREDFHKKIVRGVAMTPVFGRLMSLGIDGLSEADKIQLKAELVKAGMPVESADEAQLVCVAIAIADRAGKLR